MSLGNRGFNGRLLFRNFVNESDHARMLEGEDAGVDAPGWIVGLTLGASIILCVLVTFAGGGFLLGLAAGAGLALLVCGGFLLVRRMRAKRKS